MDKSFWSSIVAKEFAVPEGHTPVELMPELMAGLGSTDPELRDQLCLEILGTWVESGRFTAEQLRQMTAQLLANLAAGVGEGENDLVFLRTFSVLILGSIVEYDRSARFLTATELRSVMDAGLEYLACERDLRGFVVPKGWAHSAAHTADLLMCLARHPGLGAPDLELLLGAIAAKVLAPTHYPFIDGEGFRLGRAVIAVLRQELVPLEQVKAWLQGIGGTEPSRSKAFVPGQDNVRYHNAEGFLAALHLLLTYQELPEATRTELLPSVRLALKSFRPWWF